MNKYLFLAKSTTHGTKGKKKSTKKLAKRKGGKKPPQKSRISSI